jgi:hypothetical protein
LLEPASGGDLDQDVGLLVAGIPEVVDHAGWNLQLATGAGDLLAAVEPEADAAAQDLEGLVQVVMHVLVGATTRAQVQVDQHRLPVAVVGAQADDSSLTADGVLVLLAGMGHDASPRSSL